MQSPFEVNYRRQADVTIVDVSGNITGECEEKLEDVHDELSRRGVEKIVLNLSDVEYINSAGIAVLIELFLQSERQHQQVVIAGLSDYFQRIFRMVALTKFTTLYDSVEEATASF